MPSFDSPRDARVENLVRRYIENHGRKARDGKTIHMLVKLIADGLDIEAPREPSYASLVAEACEKLAFEVPHFPPPDPIGVNSGDEDDGDQDEPPHWIHKEYVWPKKGYWNRYRRLLLGKFSPDKVDALDRTTNDILRYLGNPKSRKTEWKRFGAVIGQVQSGKTGTFVGLLAKAMDAGYIHIIVLSGLHNNLRSQTQIRVDEGLVGATNYDGTWENIGVGNLPGEDSKVDLGSPAVLTTAQDAGDFAKNSQGWRGSDRPTIVVIKKNVAILQRFRAEMMSDVGTNTPKFTLPAIIIDDEADQASVNSRGADTPTAINREVRQLMDLYKRASYVGFTATPFANIFIDPEATFEDVEAGRKVPDLYPRHLIRLLQPSAEYFGPRELLAYEGDGPRLTAPADDYEDWLAPKHKKCAEPGAVPESLKDALAAFMIGTAIKRLRKGTKGQVGYDPEMNEHTTMLVHVTRYNDVQAKVRDQVRAEFDLAKHELLGGNSLGPWYQRLEAQYASIVSMGEALRDNLAPDLATWLLGKRFSFQNAIEHLRTILKEFEIEVVNGEVEDALRYRKSRERIIIAVGGDKLSRGLTLEGLTISYYLRNAANWDTLMQMGRWFGYRERYLDLCRVYMPATLESAYEEVLEAIVDLEDQLRKADISGAEPLDFCLVLVGSSMGKMPTGRMGDKKKMYQVGGYGGGLLQKRVLPIEPDSEAFRNVRKAFESLIAESAPYRVEKGDITGSERMVLYKGVPSEVVQSFIRLTNLPLSGTEEDTEELVKYLQEHATEDRLTHWTVGIPSVDKYPTWDAYEKIKIGGLEIGPSRRRNQAIIDLPGYRRTVTLIGPAHEGAGLTDAQRTAGEIKDLPAELIKPEQYRKARLINGQPTEGLLLVYPVVNAKEKDKPESGQPHHPWTVAWAMSLPPIAEDKKRRAFVPKATWDAWARTREIIEDDKEAEV